MILFWIRRENHWSAVDAWAVVWLVLRLLEMVPLVSKSLPSGVSIEQPIDFGSCFVNPATPSLGFLP